MLLLGGASAAHATEASQPEQPAHWLFDAQSRCYVLDADNHLADAVMWSGACTDHRAEGAGTATLLLNGHFAQAISGTFARGIAAGPARVVWADGMHFEGLMISGRPDGKAVSTIGPAESQRAGHDGQPTGVPLQMRASTPQVDSKDRPANAASVPISPAPATTATTADATVDQIPVAVSVPDTWLDGFSGQRLIAVDGTAMSVSASAYGMALAAPPGGAVASGYLTFLNNSQGLVSEDARAEKISGLFQFSDAALTIAYATGGTAVLSRASNGGLAVATSSGPGSMCSIWYPEGHAFSAAEREAAVAAYASRLGVRAGLNATASCGGTPSVQADSSSETKSIAPRRAVRGHHALAEKTAMVGNSPQISAEPVVVRASDVHPIDGAFSIPAPPAQPAMTFGTADKPVAPQGSPSQCLSVEADGADVGFRNHCGFEVQFAYCVVDASDPARLCGSSAPVGGVTANGFGTLFAERDPKDPEHEFRWIACDGGRGDVVPKLVRTDPPAGQCVRMRAS
jgi:hypothetical protein